MPMTPRCVLHGWRASRGDSAFADQLEQQAADLKRRFNQDFWVEDGEFFRACAGRGRRPGRLADFKQRAPVVERHRRR